MTKAIYAGSFDPPHRGHIDLIARAATIFDEVIVAVAVNPQKHSQFSSQERLDLLETCCGSVDGVRVLRFEGLAVDLARREDARVLIRGVRTHADFEAESSMAHMNRNLTADDEVETLFLLPRLELAAISSRWVKEIAGFGGDVRPMLPAEIADKVIAKLRAEP